MSYIIFHVALLFGLSSSSTPNVEPRMIFVNGDMRIGFFAKHDIDAQSEVSNRSCRMTR
jgi:SET domain-containing protein